MSVEQNLRAALLADSTVAALVGTRIYPNIVPQKGGALPAIVYTRIPGVRSFDMDGPQSFTKARIQLDCWNTTYTGAKALADAVRSALNGVGIASPQLLGAMSVQLVELDSEQDLPYVEGDLIEYRVSQDWTISYLEG